MSKSDILVASKIEFMQQIQQIEYKRYHSVVEKNMTNNHNLMISKIMDCIDSYGGKFLKHNKDNNTIEEIPKADARAIASLTIQKVNANKLAQVNA